VIDDAVVISLTERDAIQSFTVRRFFSIFSRLFLSLRILSFRSLIAMAGLTLRAKYIGQQSKAKPYFTL
jgi:hypothetical protein